MFVSLEATASDFPKKTEEGMIEQESGSLLGVRFCP